MKKFSLAAAIALAATLVSLAAPPAKALVQFNGDRASGTYSLTAVSTGCTNAVATGVASLTTVGLESTGITLSGTWSGVVSFSASVDGINYVPLLVFPQAGGNGVPTATANGTWLVNVGGYHDVCAYFSTATSGTVKAYFEGSVHSQIATPPSALGTPFTCGVTNSSGTTLANFVASGAWGACTTPGAGLSMYITDISASSSAAATTTTDQLLELKQGTGANCGSSTAVVWSNYNVANAQVDSHFVTPIKISANTALCWMDAVTGSKNFNITGYIAP